MGLDPGSEAALGKAPVRREALRRTLLVAAPLAGLLALSVRVDTSALAGKTGWWADAIGQLGRVWSLLLAILAAAALLGLSRLRRRLPLGEPAAEHHGAWVFFLGHLVALAGFSALTIVVVEGDVLSSRYCVAWGFGWLSLGLVASVLWCLAALPPASWLRVVRNGWRLALAASAIGAGAWGAARLTDEFWEPLRKPTFWAVQGFLKVLGQEIVSDPSAYVLGTRTFSVTIAADCSGYEGIGLVWVFLGVYVWLFRRELRFPQALLLFPAGTVLIWLLNAARITALVIVGTSVSRDVALGGFHSQAGWLSFLAVSLGLVFLAQRTSLFSRTPAVAKARARSSGLTAAYLAPLLALVGTAMITGAFSGGFDRLYPVRVLVTGGAVWLCWRGRLARVMLRGCLSKTALGTGAVVFGIWMALEWSSGGGAAGASVADGLRAMPAGWAVAWLIFRAVGSVVAVPIAEELAFRGYLLRRLVSSDFQSVPADRFTWFSFLASSVLFGALHGRWLAGTVAGMFYALAMYRRGRLADAVVAHATTNALIAAYVLGTGSWSLWV